MRSHWLLTPFLSLAANVVSISALDIHCSWYKGLDLWRESNIKVLLLLLLENQFNLALVVEVELKCNPYWKQHFVLGTLAKFGSLQGGHTSCEDQNSDIILIASFSSKVTTLAYIAAEENHDEIRCVYFEVTVGWKNSNLGLKNKKMAVFEVFCRL